MKQQIQIQKTLQEEANLKTKKFKIITKMQQRSTKP